MADSYPAVGLRIDLSELAQAHQGYDKLERQIDNVGAAAARSVQKVDAANAQAMRMLRQRMALTKQMFDEEREGEYGTARARQMSSGEVLSARRRLTASMTAEAERESKGERAAQETATRNFRRLMDERIQAGRRAADEQIRADGRSFEFARRMWSQRTGEAQRAAAAEVKAANDAAREKARAETYLSSVRARSFAMEAADRKRAAREAERDEMAAMRRTIANRAGRPEARQGVVQIGSAREILGLNAAMSAGTGIVGRFGGALSSFRNVLGGVRSALFDARTAIAVFAGAMVIGPLVEMADAMTALEARTRFYAARASDVPYTFQAIYRTAQDARAPLEAVATLYTRLAPLAERLGRTQSDILRVSRTVAQGAAVGGASPEEAKSSSQQLAQALASNRLGGDELRSLAENAPILLSEIAKSLNMNTGEFIKWAHEGKANAAVVIGAIEQASGRISEMFNRMPVTVGQAITVVGNAFQYFVGEVDRATNASNNLATAIVGMRAFFESPQTIQSAADVVNGVATAFNFLGQSIQFVVDAAPAIGATVAAMLAARVLPPIFLALNRAMVVFAAGASGIGAASMAANIGMSAMAAGAIRARAALSGVLALVGGPLGLAIIAAASAWAYYNANQMDGIEAAQKFEEAQGNAGNALERAAGFAERYGQSTAGITTIMLNLNNVQNEVTKGLDEAGRAAVARAENERRLTIALLARAAAEQTAAAAGLRRSVVFDRIEAGFRATAADFSLTDAGRAENRRRADAATAQGNFKDKLAGDLEVGARGSMDAIDMVRKMDLAITEPAANGNRPKPGSNSPSGQKGMSGAINAIAVMRAEVAGLKEEVASVDANPLVAFAAQIEKAAAIAEGRRSAGKGEVFQSEAGKLAAQKEELTIRMKLMQSSAEQQRNSQREAALAGIAADANLKGASALDELYSAGATTWEAYDRALNRQADTQLAAKKAQNELNIATEHGTVAVAHIASMYAAATGVTLAEAQAVQDAAQAALDAANATDTLADAEERRQNIRDRLTSANVRVDDMHRGDMDELSMAQQVATVREADARTRILAEQIYLRALRDGLAISEEQANAQARAIALAEEYALRISRLKVDIQDSIRDAFIETGRLDFKNLRKRMTEEMRRAVYDALLAKPITIVVNAVVDWATQGLQRVLGNFLGGQGQGGGLMESLAGLFGMNRASGAPSVPAGFENTPASLSRAAAGIGGATSKLTAVLGTLGQAAGFAAIGSMATNLLGVGTKSAGGQIGGALGGAAAGMLIGGPIAAVIGALAGALLGGTIGGKPTNAGAGVEIIGNSRIGRITGNKRTEETEQAGRAAAQAIIDGVKALQAAGINPTQQITGLVIGGRDPSQIYTSGGQTITSATGDIAAAAEAGLKALLTSANFVSEAQKRYVDSLVATGAAFDEIIKNLERYNEAQKFGGSIEREILKYRDPKAFEVENLRDSQKERRDLLNQYGTEGLISPEQLSKWLGELTILEQLEMSDLLTKFADGLSDANRSLTEYQEQQKRIRDYSASLLGGSLSPLGPQARLSYNLGQAQQQFALARTGTNYDALAGFTGYTDTLLNDARGYYGSSTGYNDIFTQVQAMLAELGNMTIEDPMVTALADSSAQISAAVTTGSAAVVEAVVAANENLLEQIAKQTEAIVATTAGGLNGLSQAALGQQAFDVALQGGNLA